MNIQPYHSVNIISDIAGDYLAMISLLKSMPSADFNICLGDIIDRGEMSKECLDFFKKEDNILLMGNHEHMLLDFLLNSGYYDAPGSQDCIYFSNGGFSTLLSLGIVSPLKERKPLSIPFLPPYLRDCIHKTKSSIEGHLRSFKRKGLIRFLQSLPMYITYGDIILTHAPLRHKKTLEECCTIYPSFADVISRMEAYPSMTSYFEARRVAEESVLWNRIPPQPREDFKFQIFGHFGLKRSAVRFYKEENKKPFAACIDTSRSSFITGVHLNSAYSVDSISEDNIFSVRKSV